MATRRDRHCGWCGGFGETYFLGCARCGRKRRKNVARPKMRVKPGDSVQCGECRLWVKTYLWAETEVVMDRHACCETMEICVGSLTSNWKKTRKKGA